MEQATIIALASIILSTVSAVWSSWINSSSQRKTLVAQSWTSRAQQAIAEYMRYASKQVDIASSMYMEQYDKAYGEIFLYAPEESWNDIRELNEMIHKKNTGEEANKLFLRVVSRLASANAAILKDNK